ncbi:ATPase domain-containing protein, partial [Parageobacillus thermoglucosidasius]
MGKKKTKFVCQECGYESAKWLGRCPGCNTWNSMVEEIERTKPATKGVFVHSASDIISKPVPITTVTATQEPRIQTGISEFNRVLGGGIVKGSLVLIGGDPGIGKSTLLLQVSAQLAALQHKVLYISGEESVKQTKLRADRLHVASDQLYVLAETDLEYIVEAIETIHPVCVVIDSIQT